MHVLRIDSSAALQGSVTRQLTDRVVEALAPARQVQRDLALDPLPQITEAWAAARLVPADSRSAAQRDLLQLSDRLIAELKEADTLVIGVPVYNFGVPAALKAWIDLVARPGETFRYSENGPEGLLTGKRAIVAVASGGTPVGSEMDFATGHLRHVLGFVGIEDVTLIAADTLAQHRDETLARARAEIATLRRAA